MKEIRDAEGNFMGFQGSECGEHRTLGNRAWCHDCACYCRPDVPCWGCEIPGLRAENERLREALEEIAGDADLSELAVPAAAIGWGIAQKIAREALEGDGE